jgi:transposase
LEERLCESLHSSEDEETVDGILDEIEMAKKSVYVARATAKRHVNSARKRHQETNADTLRMKRLQDFEANFRHQKGRRTVGAWRARSFDEEIEEEQGRLNEGKEKLFREILKLAPFYEVIVLPRYLPKGKYSYLGYGKFYDRLEKVMRLRGGRVVYVSECNSTKLCHRCGCYSPPGLSRLFRCSNRRCGLVQGRDEKSATYQTLFVGMEILPSGVQDNGSRKSAPQVAPE